MMMMMMMNEPALPI